MIYPIVKYGQPVLEKRGEDITEFDTPELHRLIEDMFESMYAAKGVGLAAPQIVEAIHANATRAGRPAGVAAAPAERAA